jgi:RNA polymerase sigma factor (sigma-70 family)
LDRVQAGERALAPAARKRAAVETYARNEAVLRRTARRFSLCEDDAEEALQRALEILLTKAPSEDPRELVRWTQTVVRHEALAVRRDRERILAGPAAVTPEPDREDWTALIPSEADGPEERVERAEAVARSREALQSLKPQELRALTLLAEGYSYSEIAEMTGYSDTKINRCLAEGRERFRSVLVGTEKGRRCAEMGPLISAFCDGEAGAKETEIREHLRACAPCRATLRAYRAAPPAAAALAPTLPLGRSLLDRAHDAAAGLAARFGGGDATAATMAGGGTRGAGMAALAKVAAICVGTAGGAAACVATGVVPTPLSPLGHETEAAHVSHPPKHPDRRQLLEEADSEYLPEETTVEPPSASTYAPSEAEAKPQKKQKPDPEPATEVQPEAESTPPPEPEAAIVSGAAEYAPPPPTPAPTASSAESSASSSSGGDPSGEFGP